MRPLMIILLLGVFIVSAVAAQGGTGAGPLMAARLQSFKAMASLLSEHNPNLHGVIRDEKQQQMRLAYQSLQRQAPAELIGELAIQVKLIEQQLQALEQLPEADSELKTNLLNAILAAHYRIDHLLTEVGGNLPSSADVVQEIDQLNLAVARIGLLYQTRLFAGLMVYAENPESDVIGALDTQIMTLFEQLQRAGLEQQPLLQRSQRNYRFVRGALLDQQAKWVPDAALLYLNDVMRNLTLLRAII